MLFGVSVRREPVRGMISEAKAIAPGLSGYDLGRNAPASMGSPAASLWPQVLHLTGTVYVSGWEVT